MWQPEPVVGDGRTRGGGAQVAHRDDVAQVRRDDVAHARRDDVAHARGGRGQLPPHRPNAVQRFTQRYGWRAYALPILAVLTVLALLNLGGGGGDKTAGQQNPSAAGNQHPNNGGNNDHVVSPPVASGDNSIKVDQPGANSLQQVVASAALPQGGQFTTTGSGTFHVVAGTSAPVGSGQLYTYAVDVENGISGVDEKQFADEVQSVLSAKQSWAGHGDVTFKRVDTPGANFRVSLASVQTDHTLCGYAIPVETSCYVTQGDNNADTNRVVLNVARWARGSMAYVGDLDSYRIYMINHEVGHAIGHQHAHACLPGGQAPVMMQQTIGLKSATTGQLCTANPWPYPAGVAGTPGAEQPDTAANSEYTLTTD
jgi:hypothetical protein